MRRRRRSEIREVALSGRLSRLRLSGARLEESRLLVNEPETSGPNEKIEKAENDRNSDVGVRSP